MQTRTQGSRTIVVGGGIAGLTAAALVAQARGNVTLYERAGNVGGRAVTHEERGFRLNLGPHALYRGGAARRVLRRIGLDPKGGVPAASGGHAVADGTLHTLPGGPISLLTTGLLPLGAKLELARLFGLLGRLDTASLQRVSVADWLGRSNRHPRVRQLLEALVRLSTYTNDPARMSAGSALAQLQLALAKNVTYLDGGWQTLVDAVRALAEAAGVRVVSAARVVALEPEGAGHAVRLADGTRETADAVVLAVPPEDAAALVPGPAGASLRAWAEAAVPVRAACLDVGLARLPRPRSTFALGIDRPLYLSVHSAFARLAPEGHALIQVAKYLPAGAETDARADERELEGLLDLVQPGWRAALVVRRFLPRLTVMPAVATAEAGGIAGRPATAVPGVRGLYLAGDWVGPEGLLVDASLASAERAAALALGTASPAAAAA